MSLGHNLSILFLLGNLLLVPVARGAWGYELIKTVAGDGAAGDHFGATVAVDGSVALVGAPNDDVNGDDSGSAYLFDSATGTQLTKLIPDDGAAGKNFGWSVGVDNGIAVVGAPGNTFAGSLSGGAYVFDTSTGAQLWQLTPEIGPDVGQIGVHRFGYSVAIDNGVAIVGATHDDAGRSGGAYLFDTATGAQIAKLTPDEPRGDHYGQSVSIGDGVAIVGAYGDRVNGSFSGSAVLFDTATGAQIAKLIPEDGAAYNHFGWSVAVGDGVAVVGARNDDDFGTGSGSAYLFDTSTGEQLAKLVANDGHTVSRFGSTVAIGDGFALIGAERDSVHGSGSDSGSAYLFDLTTGEQIAKFVPQDGVEDAQFGRTVAIGGRTALVGARFDDDYGPRSGSAYLVNLLEEVECQGDYNRDGRVDAADYTLWRDALSTQDLAADGDDDGDVDVDDLTAWRDHYGAQNSTLPVTVPEPTALALLLAVASTLTASSRC